MRFKSRSPVFTLTVLVAFVAQVFLLGGTASAGYTDRSDELPGMGVDVTPYVVVGGLLVAGFVVYKLAKGKSGDDGDLSGETPADSDATGETDSETPEQADGTTASDNRDAPCAGSGLKLQLGVDPGVAAGSSSADTWDLSNVEVKVGVSLGF